MIPGTGPNGTNPNLSLNLPVVDGAKVATVKVFAATQAVQQVQPLISKTLAKFPNS